MTTATRGVLVCGGEFHDFDFARLELLRRLADDATVRTSVGDDYSAVERAYAAGRFDFLVTYTCNLAPTPSQQEVLRAWVAEGGRWFALHGTNSAMRIGRGGVTALDPFPRVCEVLGSRFVAHPPIEPYRVEISQPDHWYTNGLEPFDTTDELYLCDHPIDAALEPLLHTNWQGKAPGFDRDDWTEGPERHLVAYQRRWGDGQVLYLTLGHCRGHLDMQPHVDHWPTVDRDAWTTDAFDLLVRRGLSWATRKDRP